MTKEINIDVVTNENGQPKIIYLRDENDEPISLNISTVYLQDPIYGHYRGFQNDRHKVVGYKYKVRIYVNNVLRTFKILHDSESDAWTMEIPENL